MVMQKKVGHKKNQCAMNHSDILAIMTDIGHFGMKCLGKNDQ